MDGNAMENLVIRRVRMEELDKVLMIYAAAKRFMEAHGNPNQWTGDDAVTREGIEAFIQRGVLYAGAEGETIHFSFAYIQGDDPTYREITDGAWLNDEPYGTVHRLASAGTARGVVKRVVDWALEQERNLRIDTHQDNIVMQKALTKAGCTRCGIIHLLNGEPRIAYQKVRS